ncbi:ewing's tumor-associated antigen 1 isoform X2 [Ictalurus punctatus]|uniref:Ewing's tumor-associated antigen 1 isoform X2 n=1 Tax=Ictalurus punctatus TaxID=7998 RepID=A0A2D0QRM5_ICTPU|nr:ewing's tumor-associated antigen 1 isoform X2 [Ictalurus punctatus]
MTDKHTIDTRPTADETKEIRSRVFKLSQNKFQTNNKSGRKPTRSPSSSVSLYYGKDVGTQKHRSRIRFNGCSSGDSQSEAEALQDIIWDPASPPPVRNGKGAAESVRVVEISEIVNRIAPNSVDKDSVLQWIGDTAVPCTPEIQQPRVRRCSARRQSNNVEDLMKLAKQFDLNMTRQHKERILESLQNSGGTNCKDLHKLNKLTATHPESQSNGASAGEAKGLSHEEELHALFDGPTQYLSGRLSPPSPNCSQESRTEKTATHGMRPTTSDSKNLLYDAQVSKPAFDDDWENDDLLSDLFVLEVTQNPWNMSSCTAKTSSQIGSAASIKCEPIMVASSSESSTRAGLPQCHQITSYYTRFSSKISTSLSTFRSDDPVQSVAIKQLPKTSPDSINTDRKQKIVMTNVDPGAKDLASSAVASGKDLVSVWGEDDDDDDDDDDDLLYQACHDLEQISSSQEQQKDKNITKPLCSSPEVLPTITTSSSSMSRNSRTVQSQDPMSYKQPVCVFSCSHSIPGASGVHGNKQNLYESASASQVNDDPKNSRQQYHFTQLSPQPVTGLSGENSHYSIFKRHQSDPGALRNKVFIAAQPAVKCSAAEIERKKQEAIARRKLRLQATQKSGAPT